MDAGGHNGRAKPANGRQTRQAALRLAGAPATWHHALHQIATRSHLAGIETSITGKFKITLHKKAKLPAVVKALNFPLIENKGEWVVLGFAYNVSKGAGWLAEGGMHCTLARVGVGS